jgi:hypothetical protein
MVWRLEHLPLHVEQNRLMVQRVFLIDQWTTEKATLGVQWAGIIPYFSGRSAVDLLGKNDRDIAKLTMHRGPGLRWFYPGHLKWDLDYSLDELKPDVVTQAWHRGEEGSDEIVKRGYRRVELDGLEVYLREGSPHVRWDRVGPTS